jgi:hypothetical protein
MINSAVVRERAIITCAGANAVTKHVHRETLSPFDATTYKGGKKPGMHKAAVDYDDRFKGTGTSKPSPKGRVVIVHTVINHVMCMFYGLTYLISYCVVPMD